MKKVVIILFAVFLLTSCFNAADEETTEKVWKIDKMSSSTETNVEESLNSNNQPMKIDALKENDIVVEMKTTNGVIKIKMFTEQAPITTTNFIALANNGYYNDVTFHRVIKWFMIQWGDPEWTGRGGESIYGPKFEDEFHPDLKNNKYTISMANAWPNTNWSQFFINVADNNYLDNKHSVFWEVVEWIENVDKIAKVKTGANDKPEKDVKIISITLKQFKDWSLKDYSFDEDKALEKVEEMRNEKKEAKKDKKVEKWDSVAVHYTGTFTDWEKFDSSLDRNQTLDFIVWAGQMIPWFDAALVWMKIWDKKSITLEPKDAYWEAEVSVPEAAFASFKEAGIEVKAWAELPTAQWNVKVIDVKDGFVIIENNHQMAWKTLNFDIELVDIK